MHAKPMSNDLWDGKYMGEVALAPNGRVLAFMRLSSDSETTELRRTLFLLQLDEQGHAQGEPRQVSDGTRDERSPVWSADSQHLFFLANDQEGRKQVWFLDSISNKVTCYTQMVHGVNELACSPDGQWLALTAPIVVDEQENLPEIYSAAYLEQRKLEEERPSALYSQLFVLPVPNKSVLEVSPQPRRLTTGRIDYTQPSWTPDGIEIGILCSAAEEEWRHSFLSDLWAMNPTTGEARCLSTHDLEIACYSWSPDGRAAILIAGKDTAQVAPAQHLYLVTRYGNVGDHTLLVTPELDNVTLPQAFGDLGTPGLYQPVWSHDGQRIYFLVTEQEDVNVYSLEIVWRTLTRLTEHALTYFLALLPQAHALLLAQHDPQVGGTLYRLPLTTVGAQPVEYLVRLS